MIWKIEVTRTDGSVREVEIMYDRHSNAYCYVDLTSHHVCSCRFSTIGEAILDMMTNEKVQSYNVINCNGEEIKP